MISEGCGTRPAYIAGVTNPIFQSSGNWDLLLDISTGTVTVTKDIHANHPVMLIPGVGAPLISRTGTVKAESSFGSEDDIGRSKDGAKADFVAKADHNADNLFIEDVRAYFCVFGSVGTDIGSLTADPISHRLSLRRGFGSCTVHRIRYALCAVGFAVRRGGHRDHPVRLPQRYLH